MIAAGSLATAPSGSLPLLDADTPVTLRGDDLSIADVVRVARQGTRVNLTTDRSVLHRVAAAHDYVTNAVASGKLLYGVTTGFGGMANAVMAPGDITELQHNLLWFLKAGAGRRLPTTDVRAAMLLRANSHLRGASGVRLDLIHRIAAFLNARATPLVHEFGSIGASGDLVPLASITGALIGLDASFTVDFDGEDVDALTALTRLGLPRLRLHPKEGLAMVNGTSAMTGIAALCVHDAQVLIALALGTHALAIQALGGTDQAFHPFIHAHKPHPGQLWAAQSMTRLLAGSRLTRPETDGGNGYDGHGLVQDRYSIRCLPQYLGPIVDGVTQIAQQIKIEMNAATDNPLIDVDRQVSYHGGNFLGQYVGMGMDHLRYYLGLLAKHLDVQTALLVTPEFSNGLPPSLVGNLARRVNTGLKGLQVAGNSMMPLLTFFGNSLVDRFPTHAEQFNQNINSQGFGSANLARQAIDIFHHYMATALMFGIQAVDLRTYAVDGHYDATACLSPATTRLYCAARQVIGVSASADRPYIWDDHDQSLDVHIARLAADIAAGGCLSHAVNDVLSSFQQERHGPADNSHATAPPSGLLPGDVRREGGLGHD